MFTFTGTIIRKEWLRNTTMGNAVYGMTIKSNEDGEESYHDFETAPNSSYTIELINAEHNGKAITVELKQRKRNKKLVVSSAQFIR